MLGSGPAGSETGKQDVGKADHARGPMAPRTPARRPRGVPAGRPPFQGIGRVRLVSVQALVFDPGAANGIGAVTNAGVMRLD